MRKAFVYAEGQTEERFIKDILAPHLVGFHLWVVPVVATSKIVKSGPNFKGGVGSYPDTKKKLLRLLADSSAVAVTTMLDYYGLPKSFPGRESPQGRDCHEKVSSVEQTVCEDIGDPKFIPFLTLHEFEGLLFSSPRCMATVLTGAREMERSLVRIRRQFQTPEEIDDDPATAPHRRIEGLCPSYNKPLHGALIAARIGLEDIMEQCPHFAEWVKKLEGLAQPSD